MLELIYRYDPDDPIKQPLPSTPAEAITMLEAGNAAFASLMSSLDTATTQTHVIPVSARDLGLPEPETGSLSQDPFAIVIGCADARVPVELVLGQAANDLFVLRVAGNVLGTEVIGSVDYALHNLPTVRLIVVLGHTGCGAVQAAVDAWLDPTSYLGLASEHHLRTIVNQVLPAVQLAADAIQQAWGEDAATQPGWLETLIDTSVIVNTGMIATTLAAHLRTAGSSNLRVVFGAYNIETRTIGIPGIDPEHPLANRLMQPPSDPVRFRAAAATYAAWHRKASQQRS